MSIPLLSPLIGVNLPFVFVVALWQYLMRSYALDPLVPAHAKMADEITRIVADRGLTKPRRRRSSARIGPQNRSRRGNTVIEYKEEHIWGDEECSPCRSEFGRFLRDNFSFGSCMTAYLERFKAAELDDIRYLVSIDHETLKKDVQMSSVHAKVLMARIGAFKEDNAEFIAWLSSIALQEYYSMFEGVGILTFSQFYAAIHCKADLIRIMGDRNQFDAQLVWGSVPKFMRQNGSLSVAGKDDGHCSNDQLLEVCKLNDSRPSNGSQIEGKQKETI